MWLNAASAEEDQQLLLASPYLFTHVGPYHTPGTMWPKATSASVFASFSLRRFSFSHPVPRCLNSKYICASLWPLGDLKKEVCSGALLERCYFEELNIDCAIDQIKPDLKSKVNGTILFFVI